MKWQTGQRPHRELILLTPSARLPDLTGRFTACPPAVCVPPAALQVLRAGFVCMAKARFCLHTCENPHLISGPPPPPSPVVEMVGGPGLLALSSVYAS